MSRLFNMLFLLILILSYLLLAACHKGGRVQLHDYVAAVKNKPSKRITSLPTFTPLLTATYLAMNQRSPFVRQDNYNNVNTPNLQRKKEALEIYALNTLHMVGTLSKNNQLWAIIAAPDDTLHLVTVGNYMGQCYGKIIKVQAYKLDLAEVVPESGGWRMRYAYMRLVQIFTDSVYNKISKAVQGDIYDNQVRAHTY
ncbi:hypothetical protein BH10PSE19_BH10PSE19_14970 [soil metagenome]